MKTSNLSTRVPNTAHPSVTRRAVVLMGQILPLGKINLLGISPSPLSLPGRRSTSTWVRLRSSGIPQVSDRLFPLSNLITSLRGDCRVSSGHGRGMRTRRGGCLYGFAGRAEMMSTFRAHPAQILLPIRGCGGKVGPFPTLQVPGSDGTAPGSCSPDCS